MANVLQWFSENDARKDMLAAVLMSIIFIIAGAKVDLSFTVISWGIMFLWVAMIFLLGGGAKYRRPLMVMFAGIYAMACMWADLFSQDHRLTKAVETARYGIGNKGVQGLSGIVNSMDPTTAVVVLGVMALLGLVIAVIVAMAVYNANKPDEQAAHEPAPAAAAAPAAAQPAAAHGANAAHGGGHHDAGHGGHGFHFNSEMLWKVVAGLALVIMLWFAITNNKPAVYVPVPQPVYIQPSSGSAGAPSHSAQSSIVVHDTRYENVGRKEFAVPASDPTNGEYYFFVDSRFPKELPMLPAEGETWVFSFQDTQVCAYNVSCTDQAGQGGKASGLKGDDRQKYNADDYPAQNARYQEAVAYTGDGILELGTVLPWQVTASAAGKAVSVGFNIRRSEAESARGGGVLKIKIIK